MRRYQAVLILKPDIEENALQDFRGSFGKLLEAGKAVNIETLEDSVRDLAHAIKKHPRAHFWRVAFEAEFGLVVKLREEIRHDERLLRQVYLRAGSDFSADDSSASNLEEVDVEKTAKVEAKVSEAEETTTKEPESKEAARTEEETS